MSILDRIVTDTQALLHERKRVMPESALRSMPGFATPRKQFREALKTESLAFITEIKKASPSKGIIRADFDPVTIARQYTAGGAQALSVLTEPLHFQGSLEYLASVREVTPLPLLRKDFIVEPYQLLEARAYGADAVLLIAAILDKAQLYALHQAAEELELDCLVEIYEETELDRIDFDQVSILGVNNRDLRTFEVDLNHSVRLFNSVPADVVRVSESGIYTVDDLHYLQTHGAEAVLIGESLMRAPDPGEHLQTFIQGLVRQETRSST